MKFNKMFTYGRTDAQADIENKRPRKWDESGYCIFDHHLWKGIGGKKHFSSEYISGYTSAYEMKMNVYK